MAETDFSKGTPTAQPILNKLERLGYYLLPRTHVQSPGHSGLLVFLYARAAPDAVFAPHAIHTRVLGQDNTVHWTTFEATTPVSSVRTVAPGRFILRDQDYQEVEFFLFGGALTAETVGAGSVYFLHSRAPVLRMSRTAHSVATHLAVEVEVLFAEQRALFKTAEQSFLKKLTEADPFRLYVACLQAVLSRYEQVAPLRDQYRDFYRALQMEKAWLLETGQWTQQMTTLPALLKLQH